MSLVALVAALAAAIDAHAQTTTALSFDSQAGDYIGQGAQRTYLPSDAAFQVFTSGRNNVRFSLFGPNVSFYWYLNFGAPYNTPLAEGTYSPVRRFSSSQISSLEMYGSGRSCSEISGRFHVREIVWGPNDTLVAFAADFEQHCNDDGPGLFGAIRYNSSISDLVPFGGNYPTYRLALTPHANGRIAGDAIDCGAGATACEATPSSPTQFTLTATPEPGYLFAGWTGDCRGAATTTVHVNGPKQCGASFAPLVSPTPRTLLFLDSQTGDVVGSGRTYVQSPANSAFSAISYGGNSVEVSVNDGLTTNWRLQFNAPPGQMLTAGTYGSATRALNSYGNGMSISSSSRFCSTVTGRFVVLEIALAANGDVQRFAADFEQHCDDAVPALFGSIRYNADEDQVVPFGGAYPSFQLTVPFSPNGNVSGGGINCGTGGAACQATLPNASLVTISAEPAAGYVFLGWSGDCRGGLTATVHVNGPKECVPHFEPAISAAPRTVFFWNSQSGDYIGAGTSGYYSPANSNWSVSASTDRTRISFQFRDALSYFYVEFSAPQALAAGYYGDARRYPFTPMNGLSASGNGRGCNTLTGRFVIHEIAFNADGTVARFAADFEQHCEDMAPAFFGSIRYNAVTDEVRPFAGAYPVYQLAFTPPVNGRVSGGGIDCGTGVSACQISLAGAAQITLSATPDPGYVFLGWSGDCHGAQATVLHVNGPKACAATFDLPVSSLPRTFLFVDSETGESLGQGRKYVHTPANSLWTITSSNGANVIRITTDDAVDRWNLTFAAPDGQALAVGYYAAARRGSPFAELDVSRSSSGCSFVTGRFIVLDIAVTTGGVVQRFAADFEHHCNDLVPALVGSIRYNSSAGSVVPFSGAYPAYQLLLTRPAHGRISGDGIDCGASAAQCAVTLPNAAQMQVTAAPDFGYIFTGWTDDCSGGLSTTVHVNGPKRCAATFEPAVAVAPRTLFRWDSQPNHQVGQGRSEVLSLANSRWSTPIVYSGGGTLEFRAEHVGPTSSVMWLVQFSAPTGQVLQSGRQYLNAGSFSTSTSAALYMIGNSRSCGGGEFVVRELVMGSSGTTVVRFAADFVLTCGQVSGPLLTGSIQYNSLSEVGSTALSVEPSSLRFASVHNGAFVTEQPSPQTVRLSLSRGNVGWSAIASHPWIQVSPASGTGPALLTIAPNLLGGHPGNGSAAGSVTITLTDGTGAARTIPIAVALYFNGTTTPPFGVVDTPVQNAAGVTGAIPITGWALDDLEVTSLTICRAAVGGEVPGFDTNCGGSAQIFVGNGVFVEGARPDVLAAFPNHPRADRGGWGFMLLTNMLPNRGNGRFDFFVYARDREGMAALIGTRTMTVDNARATAPFGTIDTPAQGETIGGSSYPNFGWVLTPQPKSIPFDGSTITVWIDGVSIGSPSYNHYRVDVATLFPGLANSGGPIGLKTFNTTTLSNGLHTIVWTATDSAGTTSGLGSRYFRVSNAASSSTGAAAEATSLPASAAAIEVLPIDTSALVGRRGWDNDAPWISYPVARSGRTVVRGEEIDRFELRLGDGSGDTYEGFVRVLDRLRPLPVGSRLESSRGAFVWSPGVGFVGTYDLVFVRSSNGRAVARREVRFILQPKGSGHVGAQVVIDTPRLQQDEAQPFMLAGWAADLDATDGTGIDAVHVWAYPLTGAAPVFLGAATIGGVRPDVAAVHGERFRESGYGLAVQGLAPGNYDLAVFAWSRAGGGFVPARVVRVTVR